MLSTLLLMSEIHTHKTLNILKFRYLAIFLEIEMRRREHNEVETQASPLDIDYKCVTSNWENPRDPLDVAVLLPPRSVIYIRKWKWMATNLGNYNNILRIHLPDYGQKEKKPEIVWPPFLAKSIICDFAKEKYSELRFILRAHMSNKLSTNKCVEV